MLGARQRDERVRRCLRLWTQDAFDAYQVERLGDEAVASAEHAKKLQRIARVATRAGVTIPNRPLRTTTIMDAADAVVPGVLLAWKICSGMTHGRFWSFRALSKMDEVGSDGDVVSFRSTGRLDGVLVFLTDAMRALDYLTGQLDLRRSR
jgi:hypothetical protein